MLSATVDRVVTRHWQRRTVPAYLLWPLSMFYCGWMWARRAAYRTGVLPSHRFGVPVVVIGNVTVGGTGKTPLVIWITRQLRTHGYHPGVVSRGYGGNPGTDPQSVTTASDPRMVGDEPVLIARRSQCPVIVHPDRVAAVKYLVERYRCDIVVADDGLQHYRLARNIEVAVVDAERGMGNGFCLPAGPLREPVTRLQQCDFRVSNGGGGGDAAMQLRITRLVAVGAAERARPLADFRGRKAHAVAGIGNTGRFFTALESAGLDIIRHPFPDHYRFAPGDLDFGDGLPTIMTEKDAVKCEQFASADMWFAELETDVQPDLAAQILTMLQYKNVRS